MDRSKPQEEDKRKCEKLRWEKIELEVRRWEAGKRRKAFFVLFLFVF